MITDCQGNCTQPHAPVIQERPKIFLMGRESTVG